MRFVVDENMPAAQRLFSDFGEVIARPGRAITAADLHDVDALMVRSITQVDRALLAQANKLKFVGTATIGTDHVDQPLLAELGIDFCSAPGCNANSVAEYVVAALLQLSLRHGFNLRDKTVGIVGVGNIGKRLAAMLHALKIDLLLCDPPRAKREHSQGFVSYEQLLREADIITFHVPLTQAGEHPTYHLLDEARLAALRSGTVIINTARGDVVDNAALLKVLEQGKSLPLVLDVWEQEPCPLWPLVHWATLATPHIAGYSLDGKVRGTFMLYEAFTQVFKLPRRQYIKDLLPAADLPLVEVAGQVDFSLLQRLIKLVYDINDDDARFRLRGMTAEGFDQLRKQYPRRREWNSLALRPHPSLAGHLGPFRSIGFAKP